MSTRDVVGGLLCAVAVVAAVLGVVFEVRNRREHDPTRAKRRRRLSACLYLVSTGTFIAGAVVLHLDLSGGG